MSIQGFSCCSAVSQPCRSAGITTRAKSNDYLFPGVVQTKLQAAAISVILAPEKAGLDPTRLFGIHSDTKTVP